MSLRSELLAHVNARGTLGLAEGAKRHEFIEALPDELYEMAEAMSGEGAGLEERLRNLVVVTREAVKLCEGQTSVDAFARRFAMPLAHVNALHGDPPENPAKPDPEPAPMTFAEARPDVMLDKLAREIQDDEGVGYGEAIRLAEDRDPLLAFRYNDREGARERSKGTKVEPPRGMHLCETRPDIELAERAKARAEVDGSTYAAAERLVLAENPKLKSRYHDQRMGENALDELAYRVATIRGAGGGHVTKRKATDAALAEDPKLCEAVMAYFEADPYESANS